MIDKIELLFRKFDKKIYEKYNLYLDDFLDFYHFVYSKQNESFDNIHNELIKFANVLDKNEFSCEDDVYKYFKNNINTYYLTNSIDYVSCLFTKDIYENFGIQKADLFFKLFCTKRKNGNFMFYTEENPFRKKSLVFIDENYLFITYSPLLLESIYDYLFDILKTNNNFTKARGVATEDRTIELFKELLPGSIVYKNVCEKEGTNEHDIIIEYDKYYFIIEVKSSKIKEPLYNPEKGAIRLKEHFFSDVGIGYGYKQSISLKKMFDSGKDIHLFVEKYKDTIFKPKRKIIPIVVTLENFGPVQINYSDLIVPEKGQPYAWCISIPDLENIIEINKYLSKKANSFVNYVLFRIKHFTQIKAVDELEILELFYKNKIKGLKKDSILFIETSGTSLIDKIYFEKNGVPYEYNMIEFNSK